MKKSALKWLYKFWAYAFSKPQFLRLNKLLLGLSLRGLGILNTSKLSGEKEWLKKYLRTIKTNPIVFDIGANIGNYLNDVLTIVPSADIYAFEPHPKNFKNLIKLAEKLENNVKCFNNALGSEKKQIKLYDYENKDGSSHASLYKEVIEDIRSCKTVNYDVEMITLDEFCLNNKIDVIHLLKIDIEGNELQCLKGAKQLLSEGKIKAIQFEFNEMNIFSRTTFKDFWDLLDGFDFYRLLPGGRLLPIKKYSPLQCEIYAYQNIVAIKKRANK